MDNTKVPSNTTSISTSPSRLLALPIELQLLIYDSALLYPYDLGIYRPGVVFHHKVLGERGYAPLTPRHVALTQTSRSLRQTTSRMFYTRNRFRIDCLDPSPPLEHVERWLRGLGAERRV
jgi:hypothetical protein